MLESIIADAQKRLKVVIANRTSDYYTNELNAEIELAQQDMTKDANAKADQLLPVVFKFMDQVPEQKIWSQKDAMGTI